MPPKVREEEETQELDTEPAEPPVKPALTVSLDDEVADDINEEADDKRGRRANFRALREKLKEQAERNDRLEREMAELRGRASAPAPIILPQAPSQQQQVDPEREELKSISSQQALIRRAIAHPQTSQAESERLTEEYYNLEQKRSDVQTRISLRQVQRPQQGASDMQVGHQILRGKYPELFRDQALILESQAETVRLARAENRPVDLAMADKAAALVLARHGIGGRKPAPTDTERARHSATSSRAGASTGKQDVTLTKQQKVLALSYTKHRKNLSDEERARIWLKEVAKPDGLI